MNKVKKSQQTQPVKLVTLMDSHAPISEQFRALRTSIQFKLEEQQRHSFIVSSSAPGEGKSTVAANLAILFAAAHYRTLFVDADLRRPTVAKSFNLNNAYGLSSLLSDVHLASEAVYQQTELEGMVIIPSGPKPSNPAELLHSNRMRELLQSWENDFEMVIIDMPPVLAVTDAQIVSPLTGGTLLVMREGVALKKDLRKVQKVLDSAHIQVLGVVYNGSRQKETNSHYYYGS